MRLLVAASAVCLSLVGLASADPAAAAVRKSVDISPEGLGPALTTLAKQFDFQVLYKTEVVQGLKTQGAAGSLTPEEALTRVLAGTGLSYRYLDANTVTVFVQASNPAPSGVAPHDGDEPSKEAGKKSSQEFRVAQVDQAPAGPQVGQNQTKTETEEALEEVIVTGSHIRGVENKTNPVLVIDQAEIQQSGYTSTQDLFRSLPQNFASGDATQDGIFSANANSGKNSEIASGINLRGLGVSSTLVLLNGHRLAPSAFGSVVDVSLIPLSAIDHIEILTDGSSAIYGSDAVGGVVNIILKKNYDGAETSARFGSVSHGDRNETVVAQTLGKTWSGGNAVGTVQYQNQTALSAADRDFTSNLTLPNDLLPENRSYAATLNGRQSISDKFEFYGDVLLSKRDYRRDTSLSEGAGLSDFVSNVDGETSNISVTPGFRYQLNSQWSVDLNALYGRLRSNTLDSTTGPFSPPTQFTDINEFVERSLDLTVNGRLGATPAGDIGLAFGGSYRTETATGADISVPGVRTDLPRVDRHVTAAYGELYLPLVGHANAVPMVQALEFSAAVRTDRYSDFGSTTNPRFGVRWSPWSDIAIKASYGTSFRAPTASELLTESPSQQIVAPFPFFANPSGPGVVTALVLDGSAPLKPERARNLDFGLQYQPSRIPELNLSLSYYDIRYRDRIIQPALDTNALLEPDVYGQLISPVPNLAAAQAIVAAVEADGGQYLDPFNVGLGGVRYLADFRQQNAAVVRQSGVDLTSTFSKAFGSHTLTARLNATFTDKIDTQFAPGASFDNFVNTFASPPKWRGRLEAAWASDAWTVNGALNAVGSYVDTSAVGRPPISSWTTLDLGASVNFGSYFAESAWQGLSLSLIVLNALDRDPPYVNAPGSVLVNYDATNANPLGRFVAVELRKKW